MNFCDKCNLLADSEQCKACGNKRLRAVDGNDFCYFTKLNSFDCEMFECALKNKEIEVVCVPFYIGGVTYATAGRAEGRKLYLRYKDFYMAEEIYKTIFSPDANLDYKRLI